MNSIQFFAGATTCALGGVLGLGAIKKVSDNIFTSLSSEAKMLAGSGVMFLTVDAILRYVEETSPFWSGVAWAMPTLAVITAEAMGMTIARGIQAKKHPEIVKSSAFGQEMSRSDWPHSAAVAATVYLTSRVPKDYSFFVASCFGSVLGSFKVIRAVDRVQEMIKKEV